MTTAIRYGRWTAIEMAASKSGSRFMRCICDCGTERPVRLTDLKRGKTVSCGCYRRDKVAERMERTKHIIRPSHTKEYRAWSSMIQRCTNPNVESYPNYGGRGIKVCERWMESFNNFLEDMGKAPPTTSIDRLDPNMDYFKENCHWGTARDQSEHKRSSKLNFGKAQEIRFFVHIGVRPMYLARAYNVDRSLITSVIKNKRWKTDADIYGIAKIDFRGTKELLRFNTR